MSPPPPPLCSKYSIPDITMYVPQLDGNYSSLSSSFQSSSEHSCLSSTLSSSVQSSNVDNPLENSWFSQMSECDITQPIHVSNCFISVVITDNRPHKITTERLPKVRKTIRRENKCIQALSLPIFTVYNMRSIWGKLKCFATDMHERMADLSFLSEVWEKSENKKHQSKIEQMLEIDNISDISTPRPGAKRGGGAGIAINPSRFSVTKLNIYIPNPLEIVWAILRPNESSGQIKKIILCSLYSPPNSRKNNLLIDHISVTYNALKIQHPSAGIIICGDRNSLDVSPNLVSEHKIG